MSHPLTNMKSSRLAQRVVQSSGWSTRLPNPLSSPLRPHLRISQHVSQRRSAATITTPTERIRGWIKDAQKDYPILFPTLLVATIGSLSLLGLLAYDEYTRVAPEYSAYPTGVEQRLRVALHFTHVSPDPDLAAKNFVEALKQADDAGMDPFSKEVMGIRIRFSEMMEKFGRVKGAVEILNNIAKDSEARLQELDLSDKTTSETTSLRTGLLRGIIQARVKASTLYDSEYLQDPTSAKETLSDAVGLLVKETKDPEHGFSEDNAAGLSLAEIASMLSQMGDLYATSGEESNAVQVYMLALEPLRKSCNGTPTCKEVQVFSNIASTMTVALKRPGATINGRPPTKSSLDAARKATLKWADQAIGTAEKVDPAERDQMCELGLISAEMTKADLLLESGQKAQAAALFKSLIPRLREKNLGSLVDVARQSLQKAQSP